MSWISASDDDLMKRIAQGDERAFKDLFTKHGGKVLGYAARLLGGNVQRAEELTQDTWMKVIQLAHQYEAQGHFIAWIFTMVRNAALNDLRRRHNSSEVKVEVEGESLFENLPDPHNLEEELIERQQAEALKSRIDRLPEQQRLALMLYLTEDKSYEEISQVIKVSVSAVKSLIFRARQGLK